SPSTHNLYCHPPTCLPTIPLPAATAHLPLPITAAANQRRCQPLPATTTVHRRLSIHPLPITYVAVCPPACPPSPPPMLLWPAAIITANACHHQTTTRNRRGHSLTTATQIPACRHPYNCPPPLSSPINVAVRQPCSWILPVVRESKNF